MPVTEEQAKIKRFVEERQINYLIHFTRVENVASILCHGLIPRMTLESSDIAGVTNDQLRLDNKTDYSCLSISFPNHRMFYRLRNNSTSHWAILGFRPNLLWEKECLFYPMNAAHNDVRFLEKSRFSGINSLHQLFVSTENWPRESYMHTCDPTHEQAEVMVKGIIEPKYILGCIFDQKHLADTFANNYPLYKMLFNNPNTGFFTTRKACRYGF